MQQNKKRSKKGISLAECIIAILIVVVVSVTAIGFVNSFSTASAQMLNSNKALTNFENVRQLYMYADSQEQFDALLPVVSDVEYDVNNSMYIYDEAGYYGYFIVHIKDRNVSPEETPVLPDEPSSFSALIKDNKNAVLVEIENFTRIE